MRDATSKPIMIYNNPPVTGIDLTLDTLVRLANDGVIQYLKGRQFRSLHDHACCG